MQKAGSTSEKLVRYWFVERSTGGSERNINEHRGQMGVRPCLCVCVSVPPGEGLTHGGPLRSFGAYSTLSCASGVWCLWLFGQVLSICVLTWKILYRH